MRFLTKILIEKLYRLQPPRWTTFCRCISVLNGESTRKLCKYFDISQNIAEFISLKQPYVNKLDEPALKDLIETVNELGFTKDVIINDPQMFSIMPITLRFRHKVLVECGFQNITPQHLLRYLTIMKQKSIRSLKSCGELPNIDVEKRLASFMTQWPTSLSNLTFGDNHETTLYSLRLKILQRYLELVLDLSEDEFQRGLKTYPTIKHRPLQIINETLNLLRSVVMIPDKKIRANLYLIHVDPENLKQIIYKFRFIGGIDVKEVLRLHPKLATKRYDVMVEIRNILQEYGISLEAQRRCFDIYTLSPVTIRERLEEAKSIPEFEALENHPRFLKMIHYKNTAMNRLKNLYENRKQCLSLNVLSGSSAHYESFQNSPGDRLGKGKDLVFCITESLGKVYSPNQIWKMVKKHPYRFNVPLVQVKFVCQELARKFDVQDIYENCPILLYPWSKIETMLNKFEEKKSTELLHNKEVLDVTKLSKSQVLSLVVYLLEKSHYFTGNGVWDETVKIKS
ncbi:transcription termination factor 5, mitochondrial-like [Leguminivora glycinivorella]|uniref:transcription termination factor 5, mitochondrial-like n=1 Tax=Leguminivora glycinivorella TaxID=1035111 RepID=UPI00200CB71E|nr:transcription termination factor 5, mitochondrial-like [Leguminivora glycinivorella]